METSNFDRLLEKYVKGQLTDSEREKLELWLEVRKTNDEVHTDLTADEEEELFNRISNNTITKDEIVSLRPAKSKQVMLSTWTIRAAAAFALLSLSAVLVWYLAPALLTDRTFASNETDKVILADGSIVWLKKNSSISFFESIDTQERHAILKGEGLFEVAKNPDKPFILQCGNYKIKVLGTSFSLNSFEDTLRLKVLTGKVNVSSESDSIGIDVMPNEAIVYTKKGLVSTNVLSSSQIENIVSGSEYSMRFNNAPMDDVIERVSRKFNVAFKFKEEKLKKCTVTGDFTDRSLVVTTEMLSEVLSVSFVRIDNTIVIEGSGCD